MGQKYRKTQELFKKKCFCYIETICELIKDNLLITKMLGKGKYYRQIKKIPQNKIL